MDNINLQDVLNLCYCLHSGINGAAQKVYKSSEFSLNLLYEPCNKYRH